MGPVAGVPHRGSTAAAPEDDPAPWVARFVLVALEVAGGVRPAAQLVRWTTPDVLQALERRAALSQRLHAGGGPTAATRTRTTSSGPRRRTVTRVRAVRVCPVAPGVHEASAVVQQGTRSRAVALRVELRDDRWRATVLEVG